MSEGTRVRGKGHLHAHNSSKHLLFRTAARRPMCLLHQTRWRRVGRAFSSWVLKGTEGMLSFLLCSLPPEARREEQDLCVSVHPTRTPHSDPFVHIF